METNEREAPSINAKFAELTTTKGANYANLVRFMLVSIAIALHVDEHCKDAGDEVRKLSAAAGGLLTDAYGLTPRVVEIMHDVAELHELARAEAEQRMAQQVFAADDGSKPVVH